MHTVPPAWQDVQGTTANARLCIACSGIVFIQTHTSGAFSHTSTALSELL
jgi:hypothetical protein